jgi:cold shock protein
MSLRRISDIRESDEQKDGLSAPVLALCFRGRTKASRPVAQISGLPVRHHADVVGGSRHGLGTKAKPPVHRIPAALLSLRGHRCLTDGSGVVFLRKDILMTEKALGTVVWFNIELGYGFIRSDDGTPDTFVQDSELRRCGLTSLRENERVNYTVSLDDIGRHHAIDIKLM